MKVYELIDFRVDGDLLAWFSSDGTLIVGSGKSIEQKDLKDFVLWISKCQEEI